MYYRCLIGQVGLYITFLYRVVFKRFFYNTAAILFYLNCVKKNVYIMYVQCKQL